LISRPGQSRRHMCTYFSCWIFFFTGCTLSFIFVFPMQLKRKCSQITHMQNERGEGYVEVGSKGRRLVYWFRPGFVCHFGCASYFVYESFGASAALVFCLQPTDFASRRHQSEPDLLLLPLSQQILW